MKKISRAPVLRLDRFFALALLFSFALVVLAPNARAASVRGLIDTSSGGPQLLVQNAGSGDRTAYRMGAAQQNVAAALSRLKAGDFLAARGTVDELNHTVHVESIESLGLAVLLGVWSSSKLVVYEFENFTKMNLYLPTSNGDLVVHAGEFDYAVAPDQGDRYTIFLSDNRSVTIGSIEFKNQHLNLTVLDPKTGRVSENISLSPLSVK